MKKRIIDSHSHIGVDYFFKFPGILTEYLTKASQIGITDSLLMPTPCPVITKNGKEIVPLIWNYENKLFNFYQKEFKGNQTAVRENPYLLANNLLESEISKVNKGSIRLHFVPLVHPIFDTIEYLDSLLKQKPVAIKLHGISSAFSPYDIGNNFWNIVRKYNIPIIVHTDYDNTGSETPLVKLRNLNQPLDWIKVFKINNVKALLTHGVRLCPESAKIVNQSNNFVVGIGPDSLIAHEKERLYSDGIYLDELFSMINIDKLVFDIDYPWNIKNDSLDFNSVKRIKNLSISESDLDRVLFENSASFFNL